jgi:type IV conjugative transfer system coupling protein TraD
MKKAIKVTLKLFSCLWAISLLGLLHITTVGYFLSRNMGYQYFNYLTYVLPMALLWLSMLIHFIGVGSIITIILMDLYLLYYGLNVLYETWIYFKPVFVTQDFWYIWKVISNQTIDAGLYLGSGVISLVSIVGSIVYMFKNKSSYNIKHCEPKHKKGTKMVTPAKLARKLNFTFKASYLKLANVPMVKGSENNHILFLGTSGGGKTTALKQTLRQIQNKKQRAIIIDTDGSLIKEFFRDDLDKLLNAFDKRCQPWTLWSECKEEPDFEAVAAALVQRPEHIENVWANCARLILAELLRKMYRNNVLSNKKLAQHIYDDDIPDLEKLLEDTGANKLIDCKNRKMTLSYLMQCLDPLQIIKYLPDSETPFSIMEWVANGEKGSWLFLSCATNHRPIMKSILNYWINCASVGLKLLGEDNKRRMWLVIDELFNLDRIPSFDDLLREIRKFGGCVIVAFQNMTDLETIYSPQIAKGLLNNFHTSVIFACKEDDSAKRLSTLLGEEEVEEKKISYSKSPDGKTTTNYYFEEKTKRLVSPEEIKNLKPGYAYIKYGKAYPIAKIKFKKTKGKAIAKDFELVDHINILSSIESQMQQKLDEAYKPKEIATFLFNKDLFTLVLSNHEKIEIDINLIPALAIAEAKDRVKIELSEDKQSVSWPALGVMLNINNIKEYLEEIKTNRLFIEEYYFNDGLLVVELNDKNILMLPINTIISLITQKIDQNKSKHINNKYVYNNIKLSKNNLYFYWDDIDMKLSISEMSNIFKNDRYSAIEEKRETT